uniref:Glycosyl transferase family 25 domain-containing protein n=1 Tax=Lotharella oceanica TaxID=641309 RepID=A0A7S2TLJ6_9EUKA|mmetsp:Transcript_19307/g.36336  ORF Transcript_19307/g.36336 Transcript_19307/m.36336 type:complete len:319 (+) Transcript_19307:134-1090(+)|eukprot:CAMPEP_0170181996 /NCGR_PEP_ID=MMETSP0040_2-20121228/26621_1 /TAXON_ID=641309 /ORGANISM="Lotharella oceanica, Strain CCMP622" /LENGTH=318 /DNA_ID=CAMNT_0010427245 /DNA_START=70 /DNA_END=1026 /DNA_ORIENTATION=-
MFATIVKFSTIAGFALAVQQPLIPENAAEGSSQFSIGYYSLTMPARVEHVEGFAKRHNITMNIVPGVVAKDLNETELQQTGQIRMHYCPPTIAVALAMGHRNALKAFLDSDHEFGLVFEDDVVVSDNQKKLKAYGDRPLVAVLESLAATHKDQGWDYLNLGRCIDHCETQVKLVETLEGTKSVSLVDSGNPMCANAYMVTRKGAKNLIANTWPFYAPWDVMPMLMHRASSIGEFRMYSTTPRLFDQDRENQEDGFHSDKNPECCTKMANRFIGDSVSIISKYSMVWGVQNLLSWQVDDIKCPAFVEGYDESEEFSCTV